jgi:hypothetical protein
MRNKKFSVILMALVAMSNFKTKTSFAQNPQLRPFSSQIQTPETNRELKVDNFSNSEEVEVPVRSQKSNTTSGAPRRLQQHGLGLGLGQTFLLGGYGDHGSDKITVDLLYSYAASYSFDLLLNAHLSEHQLDNEKMRVLGATGSIKSRYLEYDNLSPFFLGGLGFYAPRARRDANGESQWSPQKITFGLNFGGGVDLRLNDQFVVGILGQMHWPFNMKFDNNQPDLRGYYFKLLMTGMYLF